MSETSDTRRKPAGEEAREPPQVDRSRPESGPFEERASAREGLLERVLARFGLKPRDERADLEDVLASGVDNPSFTPQERAMLRNVLRFHRTRVYDVMVPRADIVAVSQETPLGEMLRIFRTAGHSRLPVYGETLDDPKGMVHIRDFLDYLVTRAESGGRRARRKSAEALSLGNIDLSVTLASAKILRPVLFVPPSMPAVELLVRMQTTRTHMALVIDEYGGTDGLVSIEDLVEMVVGDIEDEHDLASQAMIEASGPDTFLADARADLEEVSAALGYDLTAADIAEDVDTIGGLIVALAGRVPARAELIAGPENYEFEVLDADPRRLKRVRIHRRDPSLTLAAPEIAGKPRRADKGTKEKEAQANPEPAPEPAPPPVAGLEPSASDATRAQPENGAHAPAAPEATRPDEAGSQAAETAPTPPPPPDAPADPRISRP